MLSENHIDQLIEECINNLCSDNIKEGAESLQELAYNFSRAGMPLKSFLDIRTYIIESAKNKTDAYFIDEKIKLAEKRLRETRTGSYIIQATRG